VGNKSPILTPPCKSNSSNRLVFLRVRSSFAVDGCVARNDQSVSQGLMIALLVKMVQDFANAVPRCLRANAAELVSVLASLEGCQARERVTVR
jgi:hypothetical protein